MVARSEPPCPGPTGRGSGQVRRDSKSHNAPQALRTPSRPICKYTSLAQPILGCAGVVTWRGASFLCAPLFPSSAAILFLPRVGLRGIRRTQVRPSCARRHRSVGAAPAPFPYRLPARGGRGAAAARPPAPLHPCPPRWAVTGPWVPAAHREEDGERGLVRGCNVVGAAFSSGGSRLSPGAAVPPAGRLHLLRGTGPWSPPVPRALGAASEPPCRPEPLLPPLGRSPIVC